MTRKRGQPDRRRKKKKKSLIGRCLRIGGALIGRHPSVAGGTAAFLVIFSFVSANAIWYQPGTHPAPFFRTRDRAPAPSADVSAARGDRAGGSKQTVDELLAEIPAAPAATGGSDATATASIPVPARPDNPANDSAALVARIQNELADRQFYSGPVDGRMGRGTQAAIQAFQAATGEPLTGEASPELLARIEATSRNAVAIPRSRPGQSTPGEDLEIAKIISASVPASIPTPSRPPAASAGGNTAPGKLVARIQAGLRNIAYSNVAIDGIAGEQTKSAIRNFEKNYRLPETGEPSQRVLDKLIAIGAL